MKITIIRNLKAYLRVCFERRSLRVNVFSQFSHLNGFSPVCTLKRKKLRFSNVSVIRRWYNYLICRTRFVFKENVFPQWSHVKGFSPVCTLKRKKMKMSVKSAIFKPRVRYWAPHMLDKVWFTIKCFPTGFTFEWFVSCVQTKKKN